MSAMMTGVSSGEHHVNLKPMDSSEAEDALRAADSVYQLAMRQISQEVELSQEMLVYPDGEGEVDKVTITEGDVEGLQPERFLSDNIVDFYIRFLERGLSPEHGNRFYFFNSFFFRKLLQSKASTGIDPCKVDYEQLRKWTKEVNLFAKDYVFIPIIKSFHWSLVIICHLNNLTRPPGEMVRSPCVVHLDPIEGQHESFEDLIRSYVLQAWMDRFQVSSNGDQLLALCQMKYVEAKVPRQDNLHNCGLYVLNYIEAFLLESTSSDFSFTSSERGPHFISPHFVQEVLGKRKHIQNLIHELSGVSQKRARKRKAIQEVLRSTENLQFLLFDEDNSEACIKDVHTVGPTVFNGQASEINLASSHEDVAQDGQSTFDGLQIGPTKYEDGSEILSPKQHYAEPKVQTGGPTHLNGSMSVTKHVSIHEDASRISRLDHEPLDGPELRHVEYQRGTESFPDMLQHPAREEVPCMDLSEVRKGKNKRGRNMKEREEVPCTELSEVQKGKNKKGRKMTWDLEETSVLLSCMVEGGRFCKGSGGATHWDLISQEIREKLGSWRSADQCRLRYDTLLKAYKAYKKHFMKTGKTFSEITQEERLDLKLATTLDEEMYTDMDEIRTRANKSQKRMKLSSNVVLDSACGKVEVALRNILPASVFSSFNEDLQSTLLNLVQECSWEVPEWSDEEARGRQVFDLEVVCRRLAIVQDRERREILKYVFELWKLDVVKVKDMVFEEGYDLAHIELWKDKTWFLKLGLYEKISRDVLCKNPQFQTYCESFPIEQSLIQYVRVLRLDWCDELEHLDLREFRSLRSLSIWSCPRLNSVTGWEDATGLASLEIGECKAFLDFPEVRYLFSLREIKVGGWKSNKFPFACYLSQISQCAKLRRLVIWDEQSFSEIVDLKCVKQLKFLEFLSLDSCTFSSIRGLSGLQALTTLRLRSCEGLRSVPKLGCLKGLTHLDMSWSGLKNIEGVEELHLLTSLKLLFCRSLKELPFLGHLKALVYLDLRGTRVKEIPGREGLTNCKILEGYS